MLLLQCVFLIVVVVSICVTLAALLSGLFFFLKKLLDKKIKQTLRFVACFQTLPVLDSSSPDHGYVKKKNPKIG
jgi:hypothetical protein